MLKAMDSEKRLKNESTDRISDLHDLILGKILSYLPVKDVIATSILSTRWKTLFPSAVPLTELDLDDSYMFEEDDSVTSSRNFMDFVDKLLNVTLRDVLRVEKVILRCGNVYGEDKIVSWVCAALRLNIERLWLMFNLNDSEALFKSMHGCSTLVELELGDKIVLPHPRCIFELRLPEECVLPNLKRLSLYSLILRDDMNSIHELLDCCPMLDDLKVRGCDLGELDTLYIQHPVINKLFIEGCFFEGGCKIVIDAPNLEAFAYEGRYAAEYVLKNIKSLHSVCIDFDYDEAETGGEEFVDRDHRLAELVQACSSTKRLCLTGNSVTCLSRSSIPLPIFQNLTCLVLGEMGPHGWRVLAQLLKSAPNLTVLVFEEGLEFKKAARAGFKSLLPDLPLCLKLHLKKIVIWDPIWPPNKIKLIEYFLKNGRVLQELIFHCQPRVEKLSLLPRYSKECQVLFREVGDCWGRSSYYLRERDDYERKPQYSIDRWF